jgi:hypothetical protein
MAILLGKKDLAAKAMAEGIHGSHAFAMSAEGRKRNRRGHAGQQAGSNPTHNAPLSARFRALFHADTDHARSLRSRDGTKPEAGRIAHSVRHFQNTAAMRNQRTVPIFQLLHQTDNADRFFDERNLADHVAGHPHLQIALGVDDVNFGPRNAAETPLIMFHTNDGRVKRERPGAELVERRRYVRRVHLPLF